MSKDKPAEKQDEEMVLVRPTGDPRDDIVYVEPQISGLPQSFLVVKPGSPQEVRYPFFDRIQIARFRPGQEQPPPGVLFIKDRTISSRHCEIAQGPDGKFYIRDTSRNGTRLDDRRLEPNMEIEVHNTQRVRVGLQPDFTILIANSSSEESADLSSTQGSSALSMATVLVGSIQDFTGQSHENLSPSLQQSVSRLFSKLQLRIIQRGGTIKDYQNDSLVAFWEDAINGENYIEHACTTALELNYQVRTLAQDKSIWLVEDTPLVMHWALSTGPVQIQAQGDQRPTGLAVIGESIGTAMRLQQYAGPYTGPIMACRATQTLAPSSFNFRNLGQRPVKGKMDPDEVFALLGRQAAPAG